MAAQLTCDPIIKITFPNGDVFSEVAPGYVCDCFRLTKGLLKPNKFEFIIRKEDLTLEPADIDFELRDQLLTAMVEVTLKAKYYDVEAEEYKEYDVEDFFYGYIQNLRVLRANSNPVSFKCVAFSPDAKMKHSPNCLCFNDSKLEAIVNYVTALNVTERMTQFNREEGTYSEENNWLKCEINPNTTFEVMPYTVQYNESPYNFLARLAKRYAEYMYYENRTFVWGKMVELPEIHMHNGTDLEEYTFEMNTNDHEGILFTGLDSFGKRFKGAGCSLKKTPAEEVFKVLPCTLDDDGYKNDYTTSTFHAGSDYFGDLMNSIVELGSTPLLDRDYKSLGEEYEMKNWKRNQSGNLDRYLISDSVICYGKAARVDLKLGSIIVLEDETNTGAEKETWRQHQPLKVIELVYSWDKKSNLYVKNWFKAIPQDIIAPPYLERDKDGLLVYGDFDIYPHCGPHYGIVADNVDPEHHGRVRVALSWQQYASVLVGGKLVLSEILKNKDNLTPWIWVASPYQGFSHGALVVPEIGDLVLVGFEQNNAERPYVIGACYTGSDMYEKWAQKDQNKVKGFKTRSGHTIEIIDADGNNSLTEGYCTGGKIHIYDADTQAYDIVLDTDNNLIRLKSKGNINLSAGGNIALHAGNNIVLDAGNDVRVDAKHNISRTAENDIFDKAKHDYSNEAVNDTNMYIKDSGTHFHMVKDSIQLQVHQDELLLRLEADKGATLYSNKDLAIRADERAGMEGLKKAVLKSDTEIQINAKTVNLKADSNANIEGQAAVNVKGGVVKLN